MNKSLERLFAQFDACPLCRRSGNRLQHILGGGRTDRPRAALVLINPTYNNVSSQPGYTGPRFPFIGVARFWQVLVDAGWLLPGPGDPQSLQKRLADGRLYLTNLVKCTSPDGDYPRREVFAYHWPLFQKELEIVRPQNIVACGTLPVKYLTGRAIKMKDFAVRIQSLTYNDSTPVYPCHFPIGRGNPRLAVAMLKQIKGRLFGK